MDGAVPLMLHICDLIYHSQYGIACTFFYLDSLNDGAPCRDPMVERDVINLLWHGESVDAGCKISVLSNFALQV